MRHEPCTMHFGPVTLISPDGSCEIPDALWPELAVAVMLEPEPDVLAQWVAGLEVKLGVKTQHRVALAASPAEARAFIAADQIARGLRQPEGGKTELPDHERGRSEFELRELDRINARLARGYKRAGGKSAEDQREADLKRRVDLEASAEAKRAARETQAGLAEVEALAQGRGEAVTEDRSGVRRLLDRDPLLSLARSGKLTPLQLEVGIEVRDLYDLRATDAGAMEYTGMPSGAHDHERFVSKRYERAKACEMLGRVERMIAVVCNREPVTLHALRWVCERGNSLTLMGKDGEPGPGKGRAFERNAAALAKALDVADDVLRRRL